MPRVKLVLEYDGTNYVGWQIQQNGPSVQGRVQMAIQELEGAPIVLLAAGRTDSGVHARGQVVAFDSPRQLPLKAYWMGLNSLLPDDIAVVRAEEVVEDFDPRRWSDGKRYRYLVSNRRSRSPFPPAWRRSLQSRRLLVFPPHHHAIPTLPKYHTIPSEPCAPGAVNG